MGYTFDTDFFEMRKKRGYPVVGFTLVNPNPLII